MQLSTRSKWLTGVAALIGAYVAFGARESAPVEAARVPAPAHTTHAPTTATVPVGQSLLLLAHRVVEQTSAGSLFAAHSWYVAPPPPPPVVQIPVAPPKPVAPPLPFTYMGSYAPSGAKPVFFLTQGDRVLDVHIGDVLDNTYSVDAFANGALVFTYKPLNQQQQLTTGGAP
jgi:hypothetical protein